MIHDSIYFIKAIFSRGNRKPAILLVALFFGLVIFRVEAPVQAAIWFSQHIGYWLCLSLVCVFGYLLAVQAMRKRAALRDLLGAESKALALSFCLGLIWLIFEPWVNRVLFDEYVFLGVSYMMHDAREAMNPAKAHLIDESLRVLASVPDKRSYLFPFLASVLHDLTGFRPANLFILNSLFGVFILPLAYLTLSTLTSGRVAIVGVILWFGFGLLPAHVNGAGYEIVNLFFIQLWLYFAVLCVRGGSARWWDIFVVGSICLSLLRNESVFFLIGTLLVGLIRHRIRGTIRVSWPLFLAAFSLAVPVAANLSFEGVDGLRENVHGQLFFSVEYLSENFFGALYFILNPSLGNPGHPLLGVAGAISGALFLVNYLGRRARRESISAVDQVLFVFSGCVGMCFVLYMCTFWGNWNDPMVSRFSIPVFFWFLAMTCWLLNDLARRPSWALSYRVILAVVVVATFVRMPVLAKTEYTKRFRVGREMQFLEEKLSQFNASRVFLVTNGISGFIPRGYAGVWTTRFGFQSWRVQTLIDYKLYDEILIAERFVLDPATGHWAPDRMHPEPDEFSWFDGGHYEVELLHEFFSSWTSSFRIYRVKSVVAVEEARRQREEYVRANNLQDVNYLVRLMHLLP